MMPNPNLALRTQPRQARSRETFERILDTAADVLEEVGYEGFNTNLLAERAGVGVRALYRYFPNKFAVLVALGERLAVAEMMWTGDLRNLAQAPDWRARVAAAVHDYYRAARVRPGYAALRAASFAIPELREIDAAASRKLEADLAIGLRGLGVTLDDARLAAVCTTIMEASNRVLDLAVQRRDPSSELIVEEFVRMITAFLETHID